MLIKFLHTHNTDDGAMSIIKTLGKNAACTYPTWCVCKTKPLLGSSRFTRSKSKDGQMLTSFKCACCAHQI